MIQNSAALGTHEIVKELLKSVLEWPGNEKCLVAMPAEGVPAPAWLTGHCSLLQMCWEPGAACSATAVLPSHTSLPPRATGVTLSLLSWCQFCATVCDPAVPLAGGAWHPSSGLAGKKHPVFPLKRGFVLREGMECRTLLGGLEMLSLPVKECKLCPASVLSAGLGLCHGASPGTGE